jgi:hypothetical protein
MRARAKHKGWGHGDVPPALRRWALLGTAQRRTGVLAALCATACLLAAASCTGGRIPSVSQEFQGGPPHGPLAAGAPVPAPESQASPSRRPERGGCPVSAGGFSCLMRRRIRAAQRYLARQPGRIGLVLHDRVTGATWHNADARSTFPAASTTKLALAADLLLRARANLITLTPANRDLLHEALHDSSDAAADKLWFAFESRRFLRRAARFGLRDCSFSASQPYWGFMYCSPDDLDHLMNYVLGDLTGGDRAFLVGQLRHVAQIQQWGVWGAGRGSHPGNKDGWEDDYGTWVVDTVGFAGPGARYTLAIMDEEQAPAGFRRGANVLTQTSALLFQGSHVPWPTAQATP